MFQLTLIFLYIIYLPPHIIIIQLQLLHIPTQLLIILSHSSHILL